MTELERALPLLSLWTRKRTQTLLAIPAALGAILVGWYLASRPVQPPLPPLPPDTGMAQVRASGVLRVAMDASYPPFAVAAADGSLHGFDVDLAQAIAGQLRAKALLLNISEDGLPDALIAGKADVVISEQRPDPRLRLAYSVPYYNAGQVLLVAASDRQITGWTAMRGKTISVELGSDADQWLRTQQAVPVQVRRYNDIASALQALQQGALAGVVTDAPEAALVLRQGAAVRIAGPALTQAPYVVAAAPQNLSLIRAVNQALATLQADGTLPALLQKDI
jgi:ABC-type amino acid transport substrate-binding protein